MEDIVCDKGHKCMWSEWYQSHYCDTCKGCVLSCMPYEGLESLMEARDRAMKVYKPRTFLATSGPVSWTLELVSHSSPKKWKVRDVDTGMLYWLDVFQRQIKGAREGRKGKLWSWDISTLDGRANWDWRHPIPRLED